MIAIPGILHFSKLLYCVGMHVLPFEIGYFEKTSHVKFVKLFDVLSKFYSPRLITTALETLTLLAVVIKCMFIPNASSEVTKGSTSSILRGIKISSSTTQF